MKIGSAFRRYLPFVFVAILSLSGVLDLKVMAQAGPRLDYRMKVADAQNHLFHLTIEATNVTGKTLDISLPSWTPGWYTIRPYAANLVKLQAQGQGRRLQLRAIDKQTYRIETEGCQSLTIDYDYYANNLAVNGAELTPQRGFFVGTNIFFYVPGHTTDTPSTLTFEIPETWKVATGLKRGKGNHVYEARNFDQLVDAPTVLGDFDQYTTTALGKPIQIVIDPKGLVTPENSVKLKDYVSRVIESQGKMFGGLPYDEYWVLYVVGGRGGGALEHENSTNVMLGTMPADPRQVVGVTSHEHFHAWNVKRIRPAGLFPYDYSQEQYVRELWVAEGVTSYYGDLHAKRAGLLTADEYLRGLSGNIQQLQANEARRWVSVSDASTVTWLTYGGGSSYGRFTVNYYGKGELLGMLLDLEIRGATGNRKSLDDVMRLLFTEYYQKGRGYTNEDFAAAAGRVSGLRFERFFAKYVTGTEELDYNGALMHAGLRLQDGKIVDMERVTPGQRALRRSWLGE
ncbi:MAG: M61 family metallopeptidase [Blastocatellia bacterium]